MFLRKTSLHYYGQMLEQMILENATLIELKLYLTNELKESVCRGRQELKKINVCTHDDNDLNTMFEKVIIENRKNADKTFEYVNIQTKKIKENIEKFNNSEDL